MASRWVGHGIGCMLLATLLSGCNYFPGSAVDPDDEFADLELDDEAETGSESAVPKKLSALDDPALEALSESEPLQGELGLHLQEGDRFPLKKTVEQRLSQAGENGPLMGFSRIDMMMSLAVEELRDGNTRLGVRYHSVHYQERDLEGHQIEFNSMQPGSLIPPQAQMYAGLVNNGFSFWIGPDNRLVDLVGFPDFLQRCVRDIPLAQRQAVIAQLSSLHGDNGVASFIDDSIGLLPVSSNPSSTPVVVQEGTSWNLPIRQIDGPVPMQVETTCKIKGLTDRTAEIDLFGMISPGRPVELPQGWKVTILGGRCMGACTVDRQTGIPTNSQVQRYVDLKLGTPEGIEIQQRKEILTTVSAFLEQDPGISEGRVTPASHEHEVETQDVKTSATTTQTEDSLFKARRPSDDLRLFR